MKKHVLITAFALSTTVYGFSADGICHKCEEIREYNSKHHKDYEYYDEYQKDCSRGCSAPDIAPIARQPASTTQAPVNAQPEAKPVTPPKPAAPTNAAPSASKAGQASSAKSTSTSKTAEAAKQSPKF